MAQAALPRLAATGRPGPTAAPAPVSVVEYGRRRTLIVVGVMLAALLQTLDATIVNVALPTIEGNVGASIDDGAWIVTGYIISNVVAIPLAPFLLQRFGRRQYYAISIIGFTAASFLCGTATTLSTLVLYRIVQGAFGGALIATSQIILRETLPPEKIGASSALFAVALTLGPALGPTLGGALTDNFSWPWVFEINVVPGTIAALIILTTLRNPAPPRRLPFDALGVALLVVGLGSLQYVLDEGERNDWFGSDRIVLFACASVLGLIAFALWELWGTKTPIVDLRIFRYRNVRVGVGSAILMGAVVFGPTIMLPQYTQGILGFTAMLSGLLMLLRAAPVLVCTPFVARLATRLDPRALLVLGCATSGASFFLIAQRMTTGSDFGTFGPLLVLSGIGQSMLLVPLLVSVIGTVVPQDGPKASSFISLSFQLGASIASTMLITIFDRRTYFHADILRSAATAANPLLRADVPHALALLARAVLVQATNLGFADAILALVPVSALGVLLVLFLKRPGPATGPAPVAAE
ncbi:MAG TPA: DHA2 family efflux MFS transporter permease subunit [Candidatus Sulfotelmatobacter sp.]|nr:DHA2 family efflux MFS transporter permease subunit [Candidatus Sulfotelmatobacter sp.]